MNDSQPLLTLEGVSKSFGGLKALSEIDFQLEMGEVMGLIGPNGAGKTTLFNVITGALPPDSGGRVHFNGQPIHHEPMHRIVRMGIARTFQNVELFQSMTVLENVMVGRHVRTRNGFWAAVTRHASARREERRTRENARELLEFVGLSDHAHRMCLDMAFGWQRLLEIARALAAEPRLLLLDEPAAGLNAVETDALGELIEKIRQQGITIILVEHDMSLTMRVSHRVLVLDQGRRLALGTPREIQSDEAVMAAYLGKQKENHAAH